MEDLCVGVKHLQLGVINLPIPSFTLCSNQAQPIDLITRPNQSFILMNPTLSHILSNSHTNMFKTKNNRQPFTNSWKLRKEPTSQ